MLKRRFRLPSPALVISMIALSLVLGGTAIAATTATHKDKKADTKLVKKLAPSLSVKHAKTANTATSATNATHATNADSATNATNAVNATNATNATHATTAGTAAPTGAAGGGLTGSYPNPGLAAPEAVHRVGAAGEPAFQNSCSNLGFGFETAGFYKDGFGTVHLVGDITACGGGGTAIFTLPAGYRPSASTRFLVEDGANDGAAGVVRINTDGTVNLFVITDPVLNGLTFRP